MGETCHVTTQHVIFIKRWAEISVSNPSLTLSVYVQHVISLFSLREKRQQKHTESVFSHAAFSKTHTHTNQLFSIHTNAHTHTHGSNNTRQTKGDHCPVVEYRQRPEAIFTGIFCWGEALTHTSSHTLTHTYCSTLYTTTFTATWFISR